MMSEPQFTERLRDLIRRRPFMPFSVRLNDGRSIFIDRPTMVFGAGIASFVSDSDGFVDFSCDEVRAFQVVTAEASA